MADADNNDKRNLEIVLDKKVKPLIKYATTKFLGVSIDELNKDITSTLSKSSFGDIKTNYTLNYKKAKKQYKKDFLKRLLVLNLGNISETAKLLGLDRRTLHRMIIEMGIDIKKIKSELLKPYLIKVNALTEAIEDVLDTYKTVLHPKKLEEMYKNVHNLSEDILKDLPEPKISMKEAEELFEKDYFKYHLEKNGHNISKTAKSIGIRFETLHRKMKKLEIC
ncbi:MAG: helix-turn-helix domain-containing protein [Candidatus Woesearchaeota archaeon]